jgi:GlpG protein
MFIGLTTSGGENSWSTLAMWGYRGSEQIWEGAYWALIWSAFIHLELWHVAFNVYWLWILGTAVERTLGLKTFLGFVVASAFVSSSIQLGASDTTGIGASGVVYGLFGLMVLARARVPAYRSALDDRTTMMFWIWLVGCVIATRAGDVPIGNAAHFGGLAFGMACAPWLIPDDTPRRFALLGPGLLMACSIVLLFWSPWSATRVGYDAYKAHLAGELDSAITGYQRALDLGGNRSWLLTNLTIAYQTKKADKEAGAALEQLRAYDPQAADDFERGGEAPAAKDSSLE